MNGQHNIPFLTINDATLSDFQNYRQQDYPTSPVQTSPVLSGGGSPVIDNRPTSPFFFPQSPAGMPIPSSPISPHSPIPLQFDNLNLKDDLLAPALSPIVTGFNFNQNINQDNLFVDQNLTTRRRSTSDITNSFLLPPNTGLSRSNSMGNRFPSLQNSGSTSPVSPTTDDLLFGSETGVSTNVDFDLELLLASYPEFNIAQDADQRQSHFIPSSPGSELAPPGGPVRRARSRSASPNPETKGEAIHRCPVPECQKSFSRRGNMV